MGRNQELQNNAAPSTPLAAEVTTGGRRVWPLRILIPLLAFALFAPSLRLDHQFHEAIETLNVATAMEMLREQRYLVPTMLGNPRLAKPPATAWITASTIRQTTLQDLRSQDEAIANRGLRELAWDVRWPACLALCLMLAATFELGLLLGGTWLGVWSAIIAATTMLFFKQVHAAIIDSYFAMVVVWTNVFLARILVRPGNWGGWIGAGIGLGLGIFFKGPMVLLLTVLPMGCFIAVRRWRRPSDVQARPRRRLPLAAVIAAVLLMLGVGLWWYALVAMRYEGMLRFWYAEVLQPGRTASGVRVVAFPWYKYVLSMKLLLPWLPLVLIGLWQSAQALRRRTPDLLSTLPAFLFLIPLVAMSFHERRYDRYVLPVLGPAAILAAQVSAQAVWNWLQARRQRWQIVTAAIFCAAAVSAISFGYYLREQNAPKHQLPFAAIIKAIRQDYPRADLFATYPPSRLLLFNQGCQISIHLDRTIRYVADPAALPPQGTQVMLRPHASEVQLPPLPDGWRKVLEAPDGKGLIEMSVRQQ